MKVLLPVFYLPPVSWFSVFLQKDADVSLEIYENFPKQTYRTRANIYGANGKLSLIIPVSHSGTRVLKDIEICSRENWRQLHWKSIRTAYQTSPYFEYYENQLEEIYSFKTNNLIEFNLNALRIIQQILKSDKSFNFTLTYNKEPAALNYREAFSAKSVSAEDLEPYFQSFSDRHGFLPDLSVLDLICNKGPETLTYIKNIKSQSI